MGLRNALSGRGAVPANGWDRITRPADPETVRRAEKWLTGPVATDDYGNEIPNDASSLVSMLNSIVPHPGQSEEQIIQNTAGILLPSGGLGPLRELARGPVRETALRIFAGPGAKTADRNALGQAKQMAEGGADNETIRAATDWFQGPDQKWRFEIDDSGSKHGPLTWGTTEDLKRGNATTATRQEALLHPQLSAAYPDTKGIGVTLNPRAGESGSYSPTVLNAVPEHINVGSYITGDGNQKANRSLMLHELQHAVQQREGFARGGSPATEAARLKAEYNKEIDALLEHKEANRGRLSKTELDEIDGAFDKLIEVSGNLDARSFDAYRHLAGEVEARDVQARMDFTPGQRRATVPYSSQGIAPEDMTINFLGGENKATGSTGSTGSTGRIRSIPLSDLRWGVTGETAPLKDGDAPPIIVERVGNYYDVIDGHHRTEGIKAGGGKNATAIVVTDDEAAMADFGGGEMPEDEWLEFIQSEYNDKWRGWPDDF